MEKLIKLFEPFILLHEHDFAADDVEKLFLRTDARERAIFGYDTRSLDWWEYWINIQQSGATSLDLSFD